MSKINLNMNLKDAICEMSDGNPGAINVMCALMVDSKDDCIQALINLDFLEIYGSKIWVCAKDICKGDMKLFKEKVIDHSIKEDLERIQVFQRKKIKK